MWQIISIDFFPIAAGMGALQAFYDSDAFGQFIVLLQIAMSIISMAVMTSRFFALRDDAEKTRNFVNDFSQTNSPLDLHLNNRPNAGSSMEIIYEITCRRLLDLIPREQLLLVKTQGSAAVKLSRERMSLVETTCLHILNEQIKQQEKGMGWLSIITSSAPLFGLLGTVWGVMEAFQVMALKGTALISELAPGVSSALLTTVVGLVVAIPALIVYTFLNSKIEAITVDLEGFADELTGRLALTYQESNNG